MKQVLCNMNTLVAWVIWIVTVFPIAGVDANIWSINATGVTYDDITDIFTVAYGLDPSVNVSEQLRVDVHTKTCDSSALGAAEGIVSATTNSSGVFTLEVDPYTMSKDIRLFNYSYWNSTGDKNAVIDLCVHAGLWTGSTSDPAATEVASFDTLVSLYIDLTDQFLVDQLVVEKKGGIEPLNNTYINSTDFEVYSYFCDDVTQEPNNQLPIQQGQAITLCVEATPEALQQGVYVGYINEFAWVRNTTTANITQWVIKNGTLLDPLISIYDCESPTIICDFSMLMLPSMFAGPGAGYGVGEARMGFGPALTNSTNNATTRGRNLLGGNSYHRGLQEGGAASLFRVEMSLGASADAPPLQQQQTAGGGVTSARPWTSVSTFASYAMGSAFTIWAVLGC